MSILIDTIRIAGFRGIKNLEISLSNVTILIGANNSGKTSILKALHLALGDYFRYLSEEDFHINLDENRVQEIIVDVKIIPVDNNKNRTQLFNDNWAMEFSDNIQTELNGDQFFAIRTKVASNIINKGSFDCKRTTLKKWPSLNEWLTEKNIESKISNRIENIKFISIDAQRDIHTELKEKNSFVGRVLSQIKYNQEEVNKLESLIQNINHEAVSKSHDLNSLKTNLEKLNQSFHGSGNAEITPFPKKVRDLSKHFSIHFGENPNNTFSMEYHGMGTRSWASILTVKSFTDLMVEKNAEESKAFFPIIAAEEPEAHLHPNAQKTLYRQLVESEGQIIVSTHSPYLAAIASQSELRYLKKSSDNIVALFLSSELDTESKRKIQREVIYSRGEILFARALILCEGETEAQALPTLFHKYFGKESFEMGINFIGVGGSGNKYFPFLSFAKDFSIPVYIFSDGEKKTRDDLKKVYDKVYGSTDEEIKNYPNITTLDGTDFEGYLISTNYREIIELTIKELDGSGAIDNWISKKNGTSKGRFKTNEPVCRTCNQDIYNDKIRDYTSNPTFYNNALIDILNDNKTKYAPEIAKRIVELEIEKFPPKIIEFFDKIKNGVLK
ncbi:AAA family ATPase [Spirobacillus cienkowskii]|uniref:AAA family ATPase n=1 Tax=Spirobacillus cienkowskii TaxID=495820 RepID=UPI0030D222C1